ncbi:methionine synthase [Yimella sp. cx-51]|nr:methionine synthase [Yimella sp. cx-51]QTH39630.1 methionine synthase [Yimella sp. cx-51]
MPGTDVREAGRMVRDLLGENDIPFLPELPARGPGADLVGRAATALVGLSVDLQPSGWRLTDAAGVDARRARSYLRNDLDGLAEAFDGYVGPLKLQWCGPWTLAASVELPRGERALTDDGATRDLVQSVAESALKHASAVQRLVPGAELIMQWDEPGLPAVLGGRLPTASGYGRVRAVDQARVVEGLEAVASALRAVVPHQILHCCAPGVPVPLVRRVDDLALAIDTSLIHTRQWDGVAELVESGRSLWTGVLPTDGTVTRPEQVADPLLRAWEQVGLESAALEQVVLTPACGLASTAPREVPRTFRLLQEAAALLAARTA